MSLEGRLRKLEAELPNTPVPSPFIEWASTLPIDDIRAIRDYLRAWDEGESDEVLATHPRHRRARALLLLAPSAS